MGVGMNSALALVGTAGVAANKIAGAVDGLISEANDANKSKQMAQKARNNSKQAVANKKEQKEQTKNTLKKMEGVQKGVNKDPKTVVQTKELMRDR